MVTIDYALTPRDYRDFVFESKLVHMILAPLVFSAAFLAYFIVAYRSEMPGMFPYFLGATATLLAVLLVVELVFHWLYVVSEYKSNKLIGTNRELCISEDSYVERSVLGNSEIKLADFRRIKSLKHFYAFYLSKRLVIIVPKRFLDSARIGELDAIVAKYLHPAKG